MTLNVEWADAEHTELVKVANAQHFTIDDTCKVIRPGTDTNYAFLYSKDTLESVVFSKNLVTIGAWAFYRCSKLTNIDLSICTKLLQIHQEAFRECSIAILKLPPSLNRIASNAFAYNEFNLSFFISLNLGLIHFSCFANSYLIYDVDSEHPTYKFFKGCVYDQFYNKILAASSNLTEIEFHPNVSQVENSAFATSLISSITLPDSITEISKWGIHTARNLEKLILSPNIQSLPQSAVYSLPQLRELIIPEGIKQIPNGAFINLPKLLYLSLPSTATIAINAFQKIRVKSAYVVNQTKIQEYVAGGIPSTAFMVDSTCKVMNYSMRFSFMYYIVIIYL